MEVNQIIDNKQQRKKNKNAVSSGMIYAKKFNEKAAKAKQKTIDKIICSSDTREAGTGYPEWAYTPKLEKLFNKLIESNDYDLLDQIGDAYIAAVYGVGEIQNNRTDGLYSDKKRYGHDRIYQLPRGIAPKNGKKVWANNEYIKNSMERPAFLQPKEYIDNIHFDADDDKMMIHWDPNNPMGTHEEKQMHFNYDYLRKQTTAPKKGIFNVIAYKFLNYWLREDR